MAYSRVLEELKIKFSPYIRGAIIGQQNRLGHGAPLEDKSGVNHFKISGEEIIINEINEQDFYEIASFVAKILKKEIGGANKTTETLDSLIAEVLHVLKFNSVSLEHNFKNIIESDILNDPDFELASDAFMRLNEKPSVSRAIENSENSATVQIAENGEYGELKNLILADSRKLISDEMSENNLQELKDGLEQKITQAQQIMSERKSEAATFIQENSEKRNEVVTKCKELREITKTSPKGSLEYENAVAELGAITEENKAIFDNESKYSKAVAELSELKKIKEQIMEKSSNEKQM